jgi:hypothetical protein
LVTDEEINALVERAQIRVRLTRPSDIWSSRSFGWRIGPCARS